MNTAYTYLSDAGVDIDDVMDYIAMSCPAYMFTGDKKVEELTITLPTYDTYPYTYYEFPSYKIVDHFYNVNIGKITNYDEVSITAPTLTATSSNLSEDPADVIAAHYGIGYIFENEEEATDIVIRYAYVDKRSQYLNKDIYNSIVNALYYLYLKQPNEVYNYMQVLSLDKQNVMAENKKKAKARRIFRGAVTPYSI